MALGFGRRLLGLCVPPVLFCTLDATMTLLGQSHAYWSGNYRAVNEMSPVFNRLLQLHPIAYVLGTAVWAAVFFSIIVVLPETLALIITLAVTIGHAAGAATWFLLRGGHAYQLIMLLWLLAAVVLALGIRYGYRAYKPGEYILDRWPMAVRWVMSAVLFAIGAYLFLWPHPI